MTTDHTLIDSTVVASGSYIRYPKSVTIEYLDSHNSESSIQYLH